MVAVKCILCYIKATTSHGLFFLEAHLPNLMVTVIQIGEVMLTITSLPLDSLFFLDPI